MTQEINQYYISLPEHIKASVCCHRRGHWHHVEGIDYPYQRCDGSTSDNWN